MRLIVFFDLPTETAEDRRNYRKFHTGLVKNGFIMMQESVYCKLLLNQTAVLSAADGIRRHKPPKGLVQMLTVTEKQFAGMECVIGSMDSDIITSDARFIEL